MKRTLTSVYAWLLLLAFLGGQVLLFVLPFLREQDSLALATVIGFALSCALTPTVHELGHILFAKAQNMCIVYTKFFAFCVRFDGKKRKVSLSSPFAYDQTQALPRSAGKMQSRAFWYTLGGLIFSAAFLAVLIVLVTVFSQSVPLISSVALGALPYAAYSFLLNVVPLEYASGRTDALVAVGIERGSDSESVMIAAMEIYGGLGEGKTYGEIDGKWYEANPILPEDDPMHAVLLELKYRRALDLGDFNGAADALNRLTASSEYLSDQEHVDVAFELIFMHAISGDKERASECFSLVEKEFEKAPLRVRVAYARLFEGAEKMQELLATEEETALGVLCGMVASEKKMLEKLRIGAL